MFTSTYHLRSKDTDSILDSKIAGIVVNIQSLDSQFATIAKQEELQQISNLHQQASALQSIEKLLSIRLLRVVDRYKVIEKSLRQRIDTTENGFRKVDHDMGQKVSELEQRGDKNEYKVVMQGYNQEKASFDAELKNLKSIEDKIKEIQDIVEKTCHSRAVDAEDISDNR